LAAVVRPNLLESLRALSRPPSRGRKGVETKDGKKKEGRGKSKGRGGREGRKGRGAVYL